MRNVRLDSGRIFGGMRAETLDHQVAGAFAEAAKTWTIVPVKISAVRDGRIMSVPVSSIF